jgi:hypothetical protein
VVPIPEDGLIRAPRVTLHDAENPREFVLLENLSPDQLDLQDSPGLKVETVERDTIPIPLAESLKQRVIEVLRIDSKEGAVTWKLRTAERVEELSASVNLADLVLVVERTGKYLAQANYRVRNRQEQFLTLSFPDDTSLWSVYVAGQPSRPAKAKQKGKEVVLIPLPKMAAGDFAMNVEVVYRGRLNESKDWLRRWAFPSPEVLGMPVAKTQWSLYLPKDFNYGMFRGNMEESENAYLELNRQSTEIEEALGLVSEWKSGKGVVRERAANNLKQFSLSTKRQADIKTEKGKELNDKVVIEEQRLNDAIQTIREQERTQPAARGPLQLDQYFTPTALPPDPSPPVKSPAKPSGDRSERKSQTKNEDSEEARRAEPQAIRNRLKEQVWSQAEALNKEQRAGQYRQQAENEQQDDARKQLDALERSGDESKVLSDKLAEMEKSVQDKKYKGDPGRAGRANAPQDRDGAQSGEGSRLQRLQAGQQRGGAGKDEADRLGQEAYSFGTAEPHQRGGLSLRIALPIIGQPLYFVKGRGDPELTVAIYPVESENWVTGSVWLVVTVLLAGLMAGFLSRPANSSFLGRNWRPALMLFGLAWWFILPLSALGFAFFSAGVFLTLWHRLVRHSQIVETSLNDFNLPLA